MHLGRRRVGLQASIRFLGTQRLVALGRTVEISQDRVTRSYISPSSGDGTTSFRLRPRTSYPVRSAAAGGAAAGLADVAGAGRAHLDAAVHAQRRVLGGLGRHVQASAATGG